MGGQPSPTDSEGHYTSARKPEIDSKVKGIIFFFALIQREQISSILAKAPEKFNGSTQAIVKVSSLTPVFIHSLRVLSSAATFSV